MYLFCEESSSRLLLPTFASGFVTETTLTW